LKRYPPRPHRQGAAEEQPSRKITNGQAG